MNGKLDNLDSKNSSAGRLIGKIGGWAALAAALIAAGLAVYISVCSARGVPAKLFGRSFARVMTGSMSPSISEVDYIIIKSGDLNELKKGDIITFYSEDPTIYGKLNTHRIIGVAEDGSYITKGDANTEADPVTVKRSKIVGKYAGKSRFLRWVNSFASGKKLIMIAAEEQKVINELHYCFVKYPQQMQGKLKESAQAMRHITEDLDKGYEEARAVIDSVDKLGE